MDENSTFAQKNPKTGLIEVIDVHTGKVVAVQREVFSLLSGHQEIFVKATLPTGEEVMLQKGVDPGSLVETRGQPFSQMLVDLVCERVANGESLTEVCRDPKMPSYTTMCRWRRQRPSVEAQLEQARRDRAEVLRDKALREAEEAESRDPIGKHTLRVDTYLKAAAFDDTKYSQKAKIEANITTPTQIIVSTGINREREVSNGNNQEQMATALPHGSGSTARPTTGNEQKNIDQIRPVSSTPAK